MPRKKFERTAKGQRPSGDFDSIKAMQTAQDLPATCNDDVVAVQTSEKDFGRLSIADLGLVARLHKEGRSQQAIASVVGCSQQSISYTLKRLAAHSDDILSVMKAKSEQALEQWEQATKVGAKRGDHRPAKEFIEAAYPELRPTQGVNGGGGGVTINIGMPGQPVQLPTITVSPVSTADFRPQLSPADATESGS